MGLEFDPDLVPKAKMGLHCAQILLAIVAWCMEIAVFVGEDAKVVGNNGWTFGVFFLTIPAWVYLIMAPRFGRTRKLAEPHVMLAVDGSFTIIWLSAFATQAAYNTSGLCGQACNISKAVVGLGVFVCLLFAASTFVSAYTLTYWKFHGNLPGYDNRKLRTGDSNIDPDKAAFSMAPHDEEAYERINADDHDTSNPYVDPARYGHANPYSHDDGNEPNSYGAVPPQHRSDLFNQDTEYTSGGGVDLPAGSSSHTYAAGARVSYSDEPAKFPSGRYDRVDQ
ncbi:hypothetical protein E4U22_006099 [Claviceps purpurea]|uniref:MARVEL domain-containing protein n=2 Tax=Claviceps TaxID=5110 RepID=M1W7N0_CLAP2|nr:hypothetical protein E4U38_007468 [Claviceps purpurea]KAG6303202.1 hypothetical protein E4U09_000687 [Claviceps aff. purpurea]CCE28533.1 uncharacterized protein CPUR_02220 [Claviceps purpurea 20.1]KAG6145137.1 hypothetical protein E4U12_000072 [Claviceps purpurea]KAG6146978.1 hypothetical protein E4U37_008317 [Claviceps purpurea]